VRCGSAGEGTGSGCAVWCTARESQLRAENKKDYTRRMYMQGDGMDAAQWAIDMAHGQRITGKVGGWGWGS